MVVMFSRSCFLLCLLLMGVVAPLFAGVQLDSLPNLDQPQLVEELQAELEKEQAKSLNYEQELEKMEKMARNIRLLAILLAIVGLSAIILLIVVFRRRQSVQENQSLLNSVQKRLAESELRYKKIEGKKLKTELDHKKKDLTDLAIDISRKREWSDQVLDQLKELRKKHNGPVSQDLRSLIINLRGQLQVDEKMEIFQENIEQVNREFYDALSKDYPDLTKSEKELCGLIRLNLSNKEIASLRNISPKSVKMGRYRLRKKLNLSPEEDIYEFLQKI